MRVHICLGYWNTGRKTADPHVLDLHFTDLDVAMLTLSSELQ